MRMRTAQSIAAASLVALLAGAGTARAQQVDTNPPLPNVLLLVDNSGSMERMINGNLPENDPNASGSGSNACNCVDNGPGIAPTCNWSAPPAPNRWANVQMAFTGTPANGFNCVSMSRTTGSTFATEYQIGGNQPYDIGYYLPFHRMVAQDTTVAGNVNTPVACVVAPGGLNGASSNGVGPTGAFITGNATDFTGSCSGGVCTGSIVTREYGLLGANPAPVQCGFVQNNDGALTQMTDLMRFGLMTFDSDVDPGTGVTGSGSALLANTVAPFTGMWSYFPGWNTGGTCTYTGNPAGCSTPTLMAVGARNPGAPAWEGRLVGFPSKTDLTSQEQNNAQLNEVLLAARPYGPTPMAGMFVGAQYYLQKDPNGPQQTDGFVQGGCRHEFIILLSDGAPNEDLQPSCFAAGSPAGTCPFPLPQQTAAALYNNGQTSTSQASVTTFAIGFAVSTFSNNGAQVNCSQFASGGALSGVCNCADPNLPAAMYPLGGSSVNIGPCCVLQCIAQEGGSGAAYFADTPGDLQKALGSILAQIASQTTTRTTPAYSPSITNAVANQSQPVTNASVYLASFNPSPGLPWSGDIQRERYQCTYQGTGYTVPTPTVQTSQGDDFGANLNSGSGAPRTFIALQPATVNGMVDASATIRPYVSTSVKDGLGQYSAKTYAGNANTVINSLTGNDSTGAALGITSNADPGCAYTSTQGGAQKYLKAADCATMLLDYTFAQQSFAFEGSYPDFAFVSRYGNALGSIYHANPIVVGAPGSLLQDPLYVAFRQAWPPSTSTSAATVSCPQGSATCRNTVVYAATNDGLLHAFWADETKLENNEMWAMVPPAVMPNIKSSYPASRYFLLDGSPVVKDVVWDRNTTTAQGSGCSGPGSSGCGWHTMLVAGYGSYAGNYYPGYYAVDVTDPNPANVQSATVPQDPGSGTPGPVFMWQLTKMPSTNFQIFGSQSATPAITTLFVDPGDGNGAREIGVAILPGGLNGPPTTSSGNGSACARALKTSDSAPINTYPARASVRCWGSSSPPSASDPVPGRTLTIVRLDTGEILRVFGRAADFAAYPNDTLATAKLVNDTALDSPMTGTPIVYPSDVGTDATKVFVGDADGTMWKFDLSSSDPSQWTGELFLDLYNTTVDPNTSTSWADGQPFQVNPTLSLDRSGELVIDAATGNIQTFDTNGLEYVYSITEKVQGNPAKLRAYVNWYLAPPILQAGERVSGPMTVFNSVLYFSTYAAAPSGSQSCQGGTARLWGLDFVNANNSDPSKGGTPELQAPPPSPPTNPAPQNIVAGSSVIPGVSILGTPACAGLGSGTPDQYVYGSSHASPQNFSSGGYSLFAQVGAKGSNGASTQTFQSPVPTPVSPTVIDSWAGVVE